MHTAPANDAPRIPISLITGFLGSGKTTLLGRLLRSPKMADTAVVINEFGQIGLDHHLIEAVDGETVLLDSGCICCTVRNDLADTLAGLYRKSRTGELPRFRRVVIETTGLADPAPILHTLMSDQALTSSFCLGDVIVTVDAVNGAAQLDAYPESVKQAAVADRIVLTKTDLAGGDTSELAARLARLNPGAPVHSAIGGDIDPDLLFGGGLYDPQTKTANVQAWLRDEAIQSAHAETAHGCGAHCDDPGHRHAQRHDAAIRSEVLTFDTPLEWAVVSDWLGGLAFFHGAGLLRMKGILNVAGEAAPIAVHAVHHLFHPPVYLPAWPSADRRSRLVFITRDLPPGEIEAALQRAQAAAVSD